MKNKKMFRNWFVLFFTIVSLTAGILLTDKSAEAGKCVSLCNQHFLGGCHGSQPNYAAAAVSTRGTCIVRLNNTPETDFNTIIADMSCDSNNNNQTCLPEFCPTFGFGLSASNSLCQVYYDTTGANNAECKDSITIKGDTWDNTRHECIECSGNQGYVWGTPASIAYATPSLVFKEACGAAAVCDGKTVGGACGAGVCDKNGACCIPPNILDLGNNCVPPAACNNDGTCDNPGETTANCPNDCCTKTACGAGCTNAADCMTIEPDCAGACIAPACVTDTDCGYWVCDSVAGYIAEDCDSGAFLICGGLDGTNCGGGKVWNCGGVCNPACDPSWFPGGCGVTPQCVDEYDACDCVCAVAATFCGDGICNGAETNVSCPGDCPPTCTATETPEATCDDGVDNDCDTFIDCADLNCVGTPACVSGGCDNDNIKEAGEQCDGTDLDGKDCTTFGFTGGTLSCTGSCTFDTSACTGSTSTGIPCGLGTGELCNPLTGWSTIPDIAEGMLNYLLGLVGSIALLFLIIAGVMYMTAAGNEERITSAKKILTGALIGLAIVLLAYSLLVEIRNILGVI